jgi:hypothetical protein
MAAPAFGQDLKALRQKELDAFAQAKPEAALGKMSPAEKLLAIEEVRDVPLRYARCTSQKDVECLRNLFSPELEVSHPAIDGGAILRGGDGMVKLMQTVGSLTDRMITIIHCYGSEVELLSPTKARARWSGEILSYYPPEQRAAATGKELAAPGEQLRVYTVFYQTFEKLNGQWKIRSNMHVDLLRDRKKDDVAIPVQESPPH